MSLEAPNNIMRAAIRWKMEVTNDEVAEHNAGTKHWNDAEERGDSNDEYVLSGIESEETKADQLDYEIVDESGTVLEHDERGYLVPKKKGDE